MQDSPFLTNPQKAGQPYKVDNPMLGVGFIILLIGAAFGFQLGLWSNRYEKPPSISPTGKSCTSEAKLCPDGSSVGRTGPNCEFSPCPTSRSSPIPTSSFEGGCVRAGCSSELCVESSESDTNTPCIYRDEYSCFTYSRCERQKNGECGWTQTPQYSQCLQNFQRISN